MNRPERFVWMNGEVLPALEARLPVESKGVMYGAGCFETFRSSRGRFLHIERHLDRLKRGMAWLGSDRLVPVGREDLAGPIHQLLEKNRLSDSEALIRIQASIGGGRGYRQAPEDEVHLMISADPVGERAPDARLVEVETAVIPSASRPSSLKLSNRVHLMEARRRAYEKGYDDALMLTLEGYLAETAIANLFWKQRDRIRTPSAECNILPGVMRGIHLELLEDSGWKLEQGRFRPEELKTAELVWVTNAVIQHQPVTQIGTQRYPAADPFYDQLQRKFEAYKKEHLRA